MTLKSFVGDLFGFTQDINVLQNNLNITESQMLNVSNNLELEQNKTTKLENEIKLLTKPINPLANYWNNKYPKANIEYRGRTFGTSKKKINIDIRLLVTPQDFHIHDILKKNNLYYKTGSMDDHIVKVYHFIKKKYYKYVYDNTNYGILEFWEFPFEVLEGLEKKYAEGYDCDSFAHLIVSFLIASKIPNWKTRVVVGNSKLGGHSTVYCHCDGTNKYHHLNSTMGGKSGFKKLSDYPTTGDAENGKDNIGIYKVWFSFNNEFSWHKFSSAARKDFKKVKGDKLFKIN